MTHQSIMMSRYLWREFVKKHDLVHMEPLGWICNLRTDQPYPRLHFTTEEATGPNNAYVLVAVHYDHSVHNSRAHPWVQGAYRALQKWNIRQNSLQQSKKPTSK